MFGDYVNALIGGRTALGNLIPSTFQMPANGIHHIVFVKH